MKLRFKKTAKSATISESVLAMEEFLIPEAGHARSLMIEAIHIRPMPSDFRRAMMRANNDREFIKTVVEKVRSLKVPIWIEGEPYPGKRFGLILAIDPDSSGDLIHISGWAEVNKGLFFMPLLAKLSVDARENSSIQPNNLSSLINAHVYLQDSPGTKQARRIMGFDSGFDGVNLVDFFGGIMKDCVLFAASAILDEEIFMTEKRGCDE